jgi:chromosomal replication initiation ATPase DnaA
VKLPVDAPPPESRSVPALTSTLPAFCSGIVKSKAALHGLDLPDDVPPYVAAKVDTNIRELEGALTRIRGLAMANNQPISLELAKQAIDGDLESRGGNAPSLQSIIESELTHCEFAGEVRIVRYCKPNRHRTS